MSIMVTQCQMNNSNARTCRSMQNSATLRLAKVEMSTLTDSGSMDDHSTNLPCAITTLSAPAPAALPQLIANSDSAARFAWDEFFYGHIRNPHTRRSYERSARRFLHWCEICGLSLHTITPAHVGHFLDGLPTPLRQKKSIWPESGTCLIHW